MRASGTADVHDITPDPIHGAAIDAACDLDREYAERHPKARTYTRPALLHEACPPGGPCVDLERVTVIFLAPGLRLRWAA